MEETGQNFILSSKKFAKKLENKKQNFIEDCIGFIYSESRSQLIYEKLINEIFDMYNKDDRKRSFVIKDYISLESFSNIEDVKEILLNLKYIFSALYNAKLNIIMCSVNPYIFENRILTFDIQDYQIFP